MLSLILSHAAHSSVMIDTNVKGKIIPRSFLGFSIEYHDFYEYFGSENSEKSKVFIQLIKNLEVLNGPVQIRLGGNSQDETRWNPGLYANAPLFLNNLDEKFLGALKVLKEKTSSRFVVGLNLGASDTRFALEWAQVARDTLGLDRIDSFEIGNEPDQYGGRVINGYVLRDQTWNFQKYLEQYNVFKSVLDPLFEGERKLRGPSFAGTFGNNITSFAQGQMDHINQISFHHYPLHRCTSQPGDPNYPTIEKLLSKSSADSVLDKLNTSIKAASDFNIPSVRMGEGNSVACRGAPGVSDTFASMLWSLDLMFSLATGGASGVNFHMGGNYAAFYPPALPSASPKIMPLYYGMLIFSRMAQNSAQFVNVINNNERNSNIKIWATLDKANNIRVLFLNKGATSESITLKIDQLTKEGELYRYSAPSVYSSTGLLISGQSFDTSMNGKLIGKVQSEKIQFQNGDSTIHIPAFSAASLLLKN